MAQWLRFHTPSVVDVSSIPGWRTKIPCATWCGKKKKFQQVKTVFLNK